MREVPGSCASLLLSFTRSHTHTHTPPPCPQGLPRDGRPSSVALYALTLLTFALIKPWPAPAFNNPAFAGEDQRGWI